MLSDLVRHEMAPFAAFRESEGLLPAHSPSTYSRRQRFGSRRSGTTSIAEADGDVKRETEVAVEKVKVKEQRRQEDCQCEE